MLPPVISRNDKKARILIGIFSVVVFVVISVVERIKLNVDLGFDVHLFALLNSIINSIVAVLLIAGLIAVKNGQYRLHRGIMVTALILSVIFLISYIFHHLFAGESRFGDLNHDGILTDAEKAQAGSMRTVYLIILSTHIPLAGIILPFVLFTAYRALTADFIAHKKLARITWPVWLYVSITGVVVYWMIRPYY